MPTTVSIILPVRDSGAYLKRCIDSVIGQDTDDWELLIINDGSSDDTCDIAGSYADKDHRISLHDSPGKGVSAARNHGLGLSRGGYVCFIDSDDYIDPGFLSELTGIMEKNDADMAQCSFFYAHDDGTLIPDGEAVSAVYDNREEILKAYLSGMIGHINLACWGKLYDGELARSVMFDETLTIQEDAFFTFSCCMKASKIACSNRPLYYYYQNPGSVMNRAFDGSKMQYFTVLDRELDLCSDDEDLTCMILNRKMITALDLTSTVIWDGDGKEYLGELRNIALDTSDMIKKRIDTGSRTRNKLFLLKHFPSVYYGLLRNKHR